MDFLLRQLFLLVTRIINVLKFQPEIIFYAESPGIVGIKNKLIMHFSQINPLSANSTKWSNTVFDYFVGLVPKGSNDIPPVFIHSMFTSETLDQSFHSLTLETHYNDLQSLQSGVVVSVIDPISRHKNIDTIVIKCSLLKKKKNYKQVLFMILIQLLCY